MRECLGQSLVEERQILLHCLIVSFCTSVISSLQRAARESPSSTGFRSFKCSCEQWSSGNRGLRLTVRRNSCRHSQSIAVGAESQSCLSLRCIGDVASGCTKQRKGDMVSKRKTEVEADAYRGKILRERKKREQISSAAWRGSAREA